MSSKFGTSGLRGLSEDLLGFPSTQYTIAFCRHLLAAGHAKPGDPVLVGMDFRASSPAIADRCVAAIRNSGFEPVFCGALPTPALACYGQKRQAASLMITGSHIPADRNGIKFYLPSGEITKQDEVAICSHAANIAEVGSTLEADVAHEEKQAVAHFSERLQAILPENALSGLTIGVYQHSTVARDMLVDILRFYGATVEPLGRSEDFIPVDTEAVSPETLSLLAGWAEKGRYDAFVSADGDGDRPLLADGQGIPLRGDLLGLMTARFLKAEVVVTPVTSNSGIERNGDFGVLRTQVGSPFVIAGMEQALANGRDRIVGFEANGGFLTATRFTPTGTSIDALPTRDCFLPILSALYLSKSERKPLSTFETAYQMPVADADRLKNYAQARSGALMSHLSASRDNLDAFLSPLGKVAEVSVIDGLRATLDDGRVIHFRPSGNAPEMRCYVEAADEGAAKALLAKGLALLEAFDA
ncbi:phosphomannomutase [Cohaesibacter intestini]|uniref:phosphomannomutase n=1 Tax=Cohaesibacter intestini TaxID=2211145 RepID=UPI000DE95542|nr:phosphomannomutase [Cohaesibacter intestini]